MSIHCSVCKTKSRSTARYCRRCGEPLSDRAAQEVTVVENQTLSCAGGLVLQVADPTVPRRGEPYATLFCSGEGAAAARNVVMLGGELNINVPKVGRWSLKLVHVEPELNLVIVSVRKLRRTPAAGTENPVDATLN